MPYIEAQDGTELYVKDWGDEDGRPVILIHGWPLSADSWDDVALALAEAGYRVIAYDRRGFGRSDQPWEGYDYDTFADDLRDVIDSAEIESGAALVGFSMGGGEVARYMSRHGGQGVSQAALIGSVVPYLLKGDDNPKGAPAEVFGQIKAGTRQDRPDFFRGFFKDFYGVGVISHRVSQGVLDWSWRLAMQAGLKGTLACVDAFGMTDFRPDLPHFKVPTLIIHGTKDATVPIEASARAAHAGIAGSRLLEYEGSPHGLFATDKDRLIRDLLAFLREGDAQADASSLTAETA
jgi:pimeloyl-ACP methyl ester carboxylesterase